MNGFVRGWGAVAGACAIYLAYKLLSKGEFVFRGSLYSFESLPLLFFIYIGGLFLLGLYLIYFAIVGDSENDSKK